MKKLWAVPIAAVFALATTMSVVAVGGDTLVNVGSPPTPFSQNKQNEPALAVNANTPNLLAAGSNDEIDEEACNAGADTTCPFTPGIGVSGIYFSFDSGNSWTQPTYTGLTARSCLGVIGPDAGCTPTPGPIGTLPWYFENGLVSDGDPALAFGPKPGPSGFSWTNGSRLYYANLTSNLPTGLKEEAFRGFEAIAVSRTDDVAAAAAGVKSSWMAPVLLSRQSSTTFSDKEQISADNASSSAFFGNVYVCWASFVGQELSPNAAPAQLQVAVSRDGGTTWTQHPIGAAANNGQRNPMDGCTVRTDSSGNAYVFGVGTQSSGGHQSFEFVSISNNGGATWSAPRAIETGADRGYYTAPAISPNGTDVYVVYNAFTTPYRTNMTDPRNLVGVVLHADVVGAATGAFVELHRGANGDPRGSSQNNLVGEFLGDYVYAVASRTYGAAVWNDARNAA